MPPDYRTEVNLKSFNKKHLMCIEYPGMVQNVNKMINTLGGLENIGIAYGTRNRRIELRFRPDDIYSKPACAEKRPTTALLLKVRMKCQRRDPNVPCSSHSTDIPQSITYVASVVGLVDTVFRFSSICDFQYLQIHTNKDGSCEPIHEKLFPSSIPDPSWLHEKVPLFLSPPLFSRFDSVHYYDSQRSKESDENTHLIGRTRKRRTGYTMFANFRDENIPMEPAAESLKILETRYVNRNHFETLKKTFEERPIWSKNALLYHTKLNKEHLKVLLPLTAYHFSTGPWRAMWVKYGYDPRKDPQSVIYQTLDYRLRGTGGLKNIVKVKRGNTSYMLPYKTAPYSRPKVAVLDKHSITRVIAANEHAKTDLLQENSFVFKPGMIPQSRQMFYQYCDIHVPEIQAVLNRLLLKSEDVVCDAKTGWLPESFDSRCREIVSNLVTAELRKRASAEQKKIAEKAKEVEDVKPVASTSKQIEISDSEDDELYQPNESDLDSEDLIDSDLEESLQH